MAPHQEAVARSSQITVSKRPKLSHDSLHRTVSDISFELSKEDLTGQKLPPILEIENAKCECCGMTEEYTPEYIEHVRDKFSGKWICGLCSEAVKEEMGKNGGKAEEALNSHMSACFRFNKFGRNYPVLHQAQAMREILKKRGFRAKSMGARDNKLDSKKWGITRSSSCIPAITREMNDLTMSDE